MKPTGRGRAWLGVLLGLLAIPACEKPSQEAVEASQDPQSVVLARVGDEVVTVEDLGFMPVRVDPSNKLEMLVIRKLAAAEARRRGLAEEPKTRAKIAEFRNAALMWEEGLLRNALYNSIRMDLTFSEAELRAHFEKMGNRLKGPQWQLRVRKFAGEPEARTAAAELGASGRLDPANSEALGPAPADQLPPELRPVLNQFQQPGDRRVLALAGSWSVVELEAYLPDAPLAFEVARAKVDEDLRAERAREILNAELARLRKEQVTIDQAALAKVTKEKSDLAESLAARRGGKVRPGMVPAEPAPVEPAPPETP